MAYYMYMVRAVGLGRIPQEFKGKSEKKIKNISF